MASSGNSLSPVEEQGVNFALKVIGRENVTLKEKQMQILRIVIVEKKDVLAVLPTGFGKSLVYQLMAPFADFMDSGFSPTETNSIVLVISPLNALIRDQVTKLRECGLKNVTEFFKLHNLVVAGTTNFWWQAIVYVTFETSKPLQ